jgi:hypothetical protein
VGDRIYTLLTQPNEISFVASTRILCTKDLLFPDQTNFVGAEFQTRTSIVFNELVRHVDRRSVMTHTHVGTHSEYVNRCANPHQLFDLVFVESATGINTSKRQAGIIKNFPRRLTQRDEITTIQTYPAQTMAPTK